MGLVGDDPVARLNEAAGKVMDAGRGALPAARRFVTSYIQRGFFARRRADRDVAAGRLARRPSALIDADLSPAVVTTDLFGGMTHALSRVPEGRQAGEWRGLMDGGRVNPDADADLRAGFEDGILRAAEDVRASGLPVEQAGGLLEGGEVDAALATVARTAGVDLSGLDGQTAVEAAVEAVQRARRNRAAREMGEWQEGLAEPGATGQITAWVDGERVTYRSDPDVAAALADSQQAGQIASAMSMAGRMIRPFILTYNAAWQAANPFIDISRSYINNPRYRGIMGPLQAVADTLAAYPTAFEARLDPSQRARILADPRTGPARRARLERLENLDRIGWQPAETRQDIIHQRSEGDPGRRQQTPDILQAAQGETLVGWQAARDVAWRGLRVLPALRDLMQITEAAPRIAAARRFEIQEGRAPEAGDTTDILASREEHASPPFGATYRGTSPGPSAAFQFHTSMVGGTIGDFRVLFRPRTRAGAAVKLATTVIAPAFAQAALADLDGGEEMEGPVGDWIRGYNSLPLWRRGVGLHLPTGLTRTNALGRTEAVLLTIPVNRTWQPIIAAITTGQAWREQGADWGRTLAEGGKAALAGLAPSVAIPVAAAVDLTRDNPEDRFGNPLFSRREWNRQGTGELTTGQRAAKRLYYLSRRVGLERVGRRALEAAVDTGAMDLPRRRGAEPSGLPFVGPIIDLTADQAERVKRRFLSGEEGYGRRDADTIARELRAEETRGERAGETAALRAAVDDFTASHEYGPTYSARVAQAARRFERGLPRTMSSRQRAAERRQFADRAFFAARENAEYRGFMFGSAADRDEAVARRSRADGPGPVRDWIRRAKRAGVIGDKVADRWMGVARRGKV